MAELISKGLERRLSREEHVLLLKLTQVWFPAPVGLLTDPELQFQRNLMPSSDLPRHLSTHIPT